MGNPADRPLDSFAILLTTLVCAIWGGAFVAIKIGLLDMPPLGSAALRFLLTALLLLFWAWLKGVSLFPRGVDLGVLGLLALIFSYMNLALYIGTAHTTSGRATVFFYSQPVFLALMAHITLPNERLTVRKGWGLGLALIGLILLFLTKMHLGHAPTMWGDSLVLSAAVATATYNLIVKRAAGSIHPVALIFGSSLATGLLLGGCSWGFEDLTSFVFTWRAIASLLYLSVISAAFGFVVFAWLLQNYSATRVTALVFLAPVFGVFLGWLLLQETLTMVQVLGVGGVCAGVYLVSSKGRAPAVSLLPEEAPAKL